MADTTIRMNQLDQITNPTGGKTLVNMNGVDVQTPVEKILLAASLLSDTEKQTVLDGLSSYSKAGVSQQIALQMKDALNTIQSLLVGGHEITMVLAGLPDQIKAYVADAIATEIIKIKNRDVTIQNLLVAQQEIVLAMSILAKNSVSEDEKLAHLMGVQANGLTIFGSGSTTGGSEAALTNDIVVLPKPTSLVRIDLSIPSIPNKKEDDPIQGTVTITSEGSSWDGFCEASVQGASSAGYPKKNLNLDFLTSDYQDDVDVKLGDLMPLSTLTYKANWIDATHCRNTMSYRLWEEIVKSRNAWPQYEPDVTYLGKSGADSYITGAKGFPMGYECVIFINGNFYGIGHIMSGKKKDSYNIPKNVPTMILLDNAGGNPADKLADGIASSAIEIKAPKKVTDDTNAAINGWDTWAATVVKNTATKDDLYNHVNKANIVDFILLTEMINATDTVSGSYVKNTQVCSYDGKVFYFMPYDLDTTYGMSWTGGEFYPNSAAGDVRFSGSFWTNLMTLIGSDAINARWKELRDNGIISLRNFIKLIRDVQTKFTPDLFSMEQAKWTGLPTVPGHSTDQLITWITIRIATLDKRYGYVQ